LKGKAIVLLSLTPPPPDFVPENKVQKANTTSYPYSLEVKRDLPLYKVLLKGQVGSVLRKTALAREPNVYHRPQLGCFCFLFSTCVGYICQNWTFSSLISLLVVKLYFLGPLQTFFRFLILIELRKWGHPEPGQLPGDYSFIHIH
jgi:hypothetical protein